MRGLFAVEGPRAPGSEKAQSLGFGDLTFGFWFATDVEG